MLQTFDEALVLGLGLREGLRIDRPRRTSAPDTYFVSSHLGALALWHGLASPDYDLATLRFYDDYLSYAL